MIWITVMAINVVCKITAAPGGSFGFDGASSASNGARTREEIAALARDKHEKALTSNVVSAGEIGVTYDMIGGLTEVKELLREFRPQRSEAAAAAAAHAYFAELDADGSGELEKGELDDFLWKLHLERRGKLQEAWREFDWDGGGSLDVGEFGRLMKCAISSDGRGEIFPEGQPELTAAQVREA